MGRTRLKRLVAALGLTLLAGQPSSAGSWHADQTAGGLTFEATQAGARFTGRFGQFTTDIAFDPAAPDRCSFEVRIAAASAQTGESQRDGLLKGPDFFWTERYPTASYLGTGCTIEGTGFELAGELTLRGITRPVTLRFNFEPGANRMAGEATIRRLDFGVGQGEWASTEWVGGEVTVRFELALPSDGTGKTR